ncbi:hypothetical protein GIB67_016815 [Kingdonia uniflora]|uniref:Uncharacterized protein n=1 Tax=Kingdonia uniflora TaxID=39325 RepID=A0A7J7LS68_9MAGN|nr:hypothetical protein GIB67_016815 [Kingdonia uniflora]
MATDDDDGMFGIHQKHQAPQVNVDGDTPVDHYEAGGEQYHASLNEHATLSPNAHDTMPIRVESCGLDQQINALNDELQKLKEDKDQESETNIKPAEALKEKILECKNKQDTNVSLEVELRQKSGLEECNASLSIELNKKPKENKSLKAANAILMEQIDLQLLPATPILNWTSKYKREATRVTEEANDLHKKLVNAEEMKKSLEVNNNEWEVWRQALKKALASEGMGDMGNPTFEELFE